MATDPQRTAEAANRALQDPAFAQEILEGKQDYPEVKQALLEELAEANQEEVQGFSVGFNPAQSSQLLQSYITSGPKPGGVRLVQLVNRTGLRAPLADPW